MVRLKRLLNHAQAVAGEVRFDESFGVDRVMQICGCGDSEARSVLRVGVDNGYFLLEPTARLAVRLNQAKVTKE